LPDNSVGSRQLKNNAVTTRKIKDRAVTGRKIKLATLGKVPSARSADHAANSDKLGGLPSSAFWSLTGNAGTSTWNCTSDRNAERGFAPISDNLILDRLARLPITTWSYKSDRKHVRHVGPVAQDFKAAFGVGGDSRSIGLLDEGGVALAGVQGLYRDLTRQEAVNARQDAEIARLEREVAALERQSGR